MNVGPAELIQSLLIGIVGKSRVEDIDDVQLRQTGRHGAAAEDRLIGGGIELQICHFRDRRLDKAGDGNDGGLLLPQGLHALDGLHGGAGVGDDNGHIVCSGVPGLNQLGMPVLIDDTQFVEPQELQICILGSHQRRAHAKEVHHARFLDQLHALAQNIYIHQGAGLLQGDDIQIGDLLDDLLQGVRTVNLLLLNLAGLFTLCQLIGHRPAKLLITGVADVVTQPHDGGSRRKGMLCQRMDTQIHHKLGVIQNDSGDLFFRAREIVGTLPQPQQGIAHGHSPLCYDTLFRLVLSIRTNYTHFFSFPQYFPIHLAHYSLGRNFLPFSARFYETFYRFVSFPLYSSYFFRLAAMFWYIIPQTAPGVSC